MFGGLLLIEWCMWVAVLVYLSVMSTRFLDGAMDYGHIFGNVRCSIFKMAARPEEKERFGTLPNGLTFSERITFYDSIYWDVAKYRPMLTLLICRGCMSVWIAFFICLVFISWLPMCAFQKATLVFFVPIITKEWA